ncbi:MAG: hypothetical protein KF777_21560 [Planctomycetaceae bacterium]|nr:hypothetical protein [Planctomycetaceae bacterium]
MSSACWRCPSCRCPIGVDFSMTRAADSDPVRERLAAKGVELTCPHRGNRVKPRTQDDRKLRRRRHRWKIEPTNAWLRGYGRIALRKDRLGILFPGWTQLACLLTIIKWF